MKPFLITAAILFSLFIIMVNIESFNSRCRDAGYSGAAHERCVYRLNEGGPVYEENVQFFKDYR